MLGIVHAIYSGICITHAVCSNPSHLFIAGSRRGPAAAGGGARGGIRNLRY